MTRVLVTGSAGHLGEALMRTFRARGQDCIGADLLASTFTDRVGTIVDPAFAARCMDGIDAVIHTATLHKPHVATHTRQQFVDTNVTGTLNLLEAAVHAGSVRAFVFTSTTSVFGRALSPSPDRPAAWITEDVVPVPKNIYGATKAAAEDLCELVHRAHALPVVVLRTSRFFPEDDDDPHARDAYAGDNLKVNELLYRRADVEDIVDAHLLALDRAPALGFDRMIVTATTPFARDDAAELRRDGPAVVTRYVPAWQDAYARLGWRMLPSFDRVYDNTRARTKLGWQPRHDFASALPRALAGDIRSPLARAIGAKGYHPAHGK